jgi:hypothetical protein
MIVWDAVRLAVVAAFLLVVQLWASEIAARRQRDLDAVLQPWPCEYDRGVLVACERGGR